MSATLSVADDLLRSFFQRWQRLEEAKQEVADDLKELFAEAKGQGFQPKAMRVVFADLNRDGSDRAKVEEFDAICDLYRESLTRGTRAYTREANEYAAAKGAATESGVGPDLGETAAQSPYEAVTVGETTQNSPLPASSSQQASAPEVRPLPHASGAAISDADVPAFLTSKKTAADYRPHCQRPDACGASGLQHCYACRKAMAEHEAA